MPRRPSLARRHDTGLAPALPTTGGHPLAPSSAPSDPPAATSEPARLDVLFVLVSFHVGGAERHVAQVASELALRGHRIGAYCLRDLGDAAPETVPGLQLLGPPLRYRAGLPRLAGLGLIALSAVQLWRVLRRERPAIVHFFLPEAYVIGAPLAWLAGCRRLVMSRRSLNKYQRKRPALARFERWLHRRMSMVIGNSRRVADELQHQEGVPPERLGLIYNGVETSNYVRSEVLVRLARAGIRASIDAPPDALLLVILANLISYKGHADLLEALASIADRLPADREDGIAPELAEQAQRLGLGANVRWLGLRFDVAHLLLASDVGILASHEEGFSNALLEAMAAGLPMVVTEVGGNAEAVLDGETGYVVPPRAPAAMAAAILALALDRDRARQMGAAGRRRILETFSLEVCVDQYEALYREVREGGNDVAEATDMATASRGRIG